MGNSKNKLVHLNKSKYLELERNCMWKALVLFTACYWDLKDCTQEEALEFLNQIKQYLEDIDNHKYKVKHINEIIRQEIGINIDWSK